MKKKILFAGLMAGLLLTFAGCSKEDTQGTEETNQEETAESGGSTLVKLGNYVGVEVVPMDTEPTEEEIQAEIDAQLRDYGGLQEIEGKTVIEEGDIVNIDYRGLIDGEEFDGGTGSYDLEIGSGGFIDGFEDQLIGKELGGFYSLDLAFPDPYYNDPDLSGQPVIFEVTVNKIQEYAEPELTEEFVQETLGYDSIEAYRESTVETLRNEKEQQAASQKEYDIVVAIIEDSEFDMNEDEVQTLKDDIRANYEYYASMYGMDFATFIGLAMGMTEEQFDQESTDSAEFQIKSNLVIDAVVEAEGMTVSDEEYTKEAEEIMAVYGYSSLEEFEEVYTRDEIEEEILFNRAVAFLVENSVEV